MSDWSLHVLTCAVGIGAYICVDLMPQRWAWVRGGVFAGVALLLAGAVSCGVNPLYSIVSAGVGALGAHLLVTLGKQWPAA